MNRESLAKLMRERALLIEGDERLSEQSLRNFAEVEREKVKKRQRIEEMKKLYFNAGRFVGGARDHSAREAFHRMKAIEQ